MQEDEAANPRAPPLIAAIQGGSNRLVQETMWRFARRCTELGLCVVGLIETFESGGETGRRTGWITNIRSRVSYSLFQDLGMMASACHLDSAGIVAACVDICAEIEAGCDLVIRFPGERLVFAGIPEMILGWIGRRAMNRGRRPWPLSLGIST